MHVDPASGKARCLSTEGPRAGMYPLVAAASVDKSIYQCNVIKLREHLKAHSTKLTGDRAVAQSGPGVR